MGEKTEIAWCDSTFNPWIGCQKVSAGCDNCYAETLMDKRYHKVEWGPHGERKRTAASNWRNPIIWNRKSAFFQGTEGRRQRVFCSSLADVFDNQVPPAWRADLFDLIAETPELDWLLLTKRPENIAKMLPQGWATTTEWPNVWLGTTCEDQAAYDRRWPILRAVPAAVRFISYEPAIGPLSILGKPVPDWIICGGESGAGFRDMPTIWASSIALECGSLKVPFFMKQMAGKKPIPHGLLVREFPRGLALSSHNRGGEA